jgi:uncharacterized protein (DUF4415 family)
MNVKNTKRQSGTDFKALEVMKDQDIDFSDLPPLDNAFFADVALRLPRRKKSLSIRLDPDVLEWFKHQGKGYQTRINAVLRMYMEAKIH